MLKWLRNPMRADRRQAVAATLPDEAPVVDQNRTVALKADAYAGQILEAQALHDNRQWLEAAEIYDRILAEKPDHAMALFGRGQLMADAGHHDLAADFVTRALAAEAPARPVRMLNLLAMVELERHRLDGAAALSAEVLASDPENAQALVVQANVLRSQGREGEAIMTYERALKADPNHINGLFAYAKLHQSCGRFAAAASLFKRLHVLLPKHAVICGDLALCMIHSGDKAAGIEKMREAVTLNPGNVDGWFTLIQSLLSSNRPDEAKTVSDDVQGMGFSDGRLLQVRGDILALLQDHAGAVEAYTSALALAQTDESRLIAHSALGVNLHHMGDQARALQNMATAEALCVGDNEKHLPVVRYNRSEMHLIRGDFVNGFKDYADRFQAVDFLRCAPVLKNTWWDGKADLNGHSVLVWMEQGLGDEIQFARYAAQLKRLYPKANVIFGARPATSRLLKSLAGMDKVVVLGKDPDPVTDYHVPVMSLVGLLNVTVETIDPSPYLSAPVELCQEWGRRMGAPTGRLRVGVVWAGSPMADRPGENARDRIRSLSLSAIQPILDVDGVDFYSLQVSAKAKPDVLTPVVRKPLPAHVVDLTAQITDFADTAAIISHLDLVIGVDTSTVHCAGATGCPVWLLNRKNTCWRWFEKGDLSPWYRNFLIFRQEKIGEWTPVIDRVAAALTRLVQERQQ